MVEKTDIRKIYNNSLIGPLIFTLILFLVPVVAQSNYVLSIFIIIGFYALISNGLTMLMGYAGQISLGHAAFYGIGAYMSAIFTVKLGLSSWLGMLAGMILAAIVAFIVGIPTFKLKGHYLALATLGFGVIIYTAFKELKEFTGGLNGFFGIPSISLFGFQFDNDLRFFYLIWTFVILGIIFSRNMINSRVGRALRSIEGSEIASDAVGVNIMQYKLQIFMLSAIFASASGSLYAHYATFINPELFNVMTSIYLLIMVVIGGSSSIWGSVIGAAVYVFLGEILKSVVPMVFPNAGGEFEIVFFGLLLVVTLIYMPDGLSPLLDKIFSLFKGKKRVVPSPVATDNTGVSSGGDKQ